MIKTEPGAYITHNATYPLSNITSGSQRELPLEQWYELVLPQDLWTYFNMKIWGNYPFKLYRHKI